MKKSANSYSNYQKACLCTPRIHQANHCVPSNMSTIKFVPSRRNVTFRASQECAAVIIFRHLSINCCWTFLLRQSSENVINERGTGTRQVILLYQFFNKGKIVFQRKPDNTLSIPPWKYSRNFQGVERRNSPTHTFQAAMKSFYSLVPYQKLYPIRANVL